MWDISHCSIHMLKNSFMFDISDTALTEWIRHIKLFFSIEQCGIFHIWVHWYQPLSDKVYTVLTSPKREIFQIWIKQLFLLCMHFYPLFCYIDFCFTMIGRILWARNYFSRQRISWTKFRYTGIVCTVMYF